MKKSRNVLAALTAISLCAVVLSGSALAVRPAAVVTEPVVEYTVVEKKEFSPYLLPGESERQMIVRWVGSQVKAPLTVLYGPDEGDGELPADFACADVTFSMAPPDINADFRFLYQAELTVEPDTRYVYGISAGGEEPTVLYPFAAPGEDGVFSAVFVSDTHLVNARHSASLETTLETALAHKLSEGEMLDGMFHMGDLVNTPQMPLGVLTRNVPLLHSLPAVYVAGNHDYDKSVYSFFPMPHQDRLTRDYWFVRGGTLFIGVNCRYGIGEKHTNFVRTACQEAPEHNWTVVMLHYGIRSNGFHGRDQAACYTFRVALEPIMEEMDVDLVFAGHDHEYNRTPLFGPEGVVPDSSGGQVVKAPGERVYLTVPTGSDSKHYTKNVEIDFAMAAEALEQDRGYLLVDFTPEQIRVRAVNAVTGETADEFVLSRGE